MTRAARASLAVLAAAALFGTSATSQALLMPDAPPAAVADLRLIVGSLGLIAIVWWRSGPGALRTLWRMPTIWLMGLFVAAYQACFFIGAARTGVAIGTLASLALAPFLAGLLGWAMREGAPGLVWAASTVIAIIGLAFLTLGSAGTADPIGVVAAGGAGASYAVYTVLGARLARSGLQPSAILATSFSVGAVLLLPFVVLAGPWWLNPAAIAMVLWLGLIATTLAYLLFGVGLAVLQPGHIATLNLAEPVVATVLGVLILGERLPAAGWIGCVLIIIALAMLGLMENRRREVHA